MKIYTDGELVVLCREGNEAAFQEIIVRYKRLLYSIPTKQWKFSNSVADDVFDAVIAKFFEKLNDIQKPESINHWFSTTANNKCKEIYRATKRDEKLSELAGEDISKFHSENKATDSNMQIIEVKNILEWGMSKLDEMCKQLLNKKFYGKKSYKEIADEMGYAEGTIGGNIRRCLGKMKEFLEHRGLNIEDFF